MSSRPLRRRDFLLSSAGLAAASCGGPGPRQSAPVKPSPRPLVLLHFGGGSASFAGLAALAGELRLLATYLPEADAAVWMDSPAAPAGMLRRAFPNVALLGSEQPAQLDGAIERAGLLLCASGASDAARAALEAWRKRTRKPYGILGAGAAQPVRGLRELLEGAAFVFARETRSLEVLKQAGIRGPALAFAPDGAFSFRIADEERAREFLGRSGLEPKRFLAVAPGPGSGGARLLDALESWVRRTGWKVLLLPPADIDLPAAIQRHAVRRAGSWLPDEAAPVLRRAVAAMGLDCAPLILAAANDTPPMYLHHRGAGSEGQIWKDIGLGRWHFHLEKATGRQLDEAVAKIQADYAASQVDTHEAALYARKLQGDAMRVVRQAVLG